MKNVVKILSIILVMMFVLSSVSQAQQGNRWSRGALIFCDVLLLNQEKTDKVVAVYGEVSQAVREQNSGANFRDMSDEERTKYFEKTQKETAEGLKKGLKDVLSEKEIDVIIAVMAKRMFMPVPELRGLRSIELKDEQRGKLLPLTVEFSKSFFSNFRFFGPQADDAEREKAQKAFDEAKASFIAKVNPILTDEQKAAWKTKTEEAQKENDEAMERIRNMRRQ